MRKEIANLVNAQNLQISSLNGKVVTPFVIQNDVFFQ